jgi:hypothetical protein
VKNWESEHYNSVLKIRRLHTWCTVSFLGIHTWKPDIFIGFSPALHLQCGLKLVCNVNIVYGNLNTENCQDYAQKPQQNCTSMNSASVKTLLTRHIDSTLCFTFLKQLVFLRTLLRILKCRNRCRSGPSSILWFISGKTSMIITTDDFCVSISLI